MLAGAESPSTPLRFGSPVAPEAPKCSSPAPGRVQKTSSNRKVVSVGAAGFEPTTSCTQSRRATNCATPRPPPQAAEGEA